MLGQSVTSFFVESTKELTFLWNNSEDMKKKRTTYTCSECGATSNKWKGQCDHCGAWNSLVESVEQASINLKGIVRSSSVVNLGSVEIELVTRN